MENLNIDQYLNKVDGNTLPANEWNACLTAVQTKVNELVVNANAAYIKPEDGIPGSDIAENTISANKISSIRYSAIRQMDVRPNINNQDWSSSDSTSIFGMRARDVFMFLAEGYKFIFVLKDGDGNDIHYDLYQNTKISDDSVTTTFSGIVNHPTYGLGIFTASFSLTGESFASSGSFKAL